MTGPISVCDLEAVFSAGASDRAREWLAGARRQVARDRDELQILFPAAARACGRAPLPHSDGWRTDDAARVLVLASMAWPVPRELRGLYDHGDADEKRAVLLALDFIDVGDGGLAIVEDALRTNDTRLITAALGRYGARRLTPSAYRQAILKAVFCGIPLAAVSGLADRADAELARMLDDFVRERSVAGRAVPDDVWLILARFPRLRSS
ncbi:EboA domain-containing protein [Catenulispora rubra]|uniref:EboA domain-containing protein n=1 Tax=Catenulispora rubra TaxID=280293 RepID=UPI0018927377|nr:EboA domain-containing protein [Catenulispora rubra]